MHPDPQTAESESKPSSLNDKDVLDDASNGRQHGVQEQIAALMALPGEFVSLRMPALLKDRLDSVSPSRMRTAVLSEAVAVQITVAEALAETGAVADASETASVVFESLRLWLIGQADISDADAVAIGEKLADLRDRARQHGGAAAVCEALARAKIAADEDASFVASRRPGPTETFTPSDK